MQKKQRDTEKHGAAALKHYSRSCGRNGPQHSLLHAYVGKSQRLSEGRERERLGKIPEREKGMKGKEGKEQQA